MPSVPSDVRSLLRPWSGKSPYMLVYLQDTHNNQQSVQRRTRAAPKTVNPQWREEFWFAVRKTPESLVLRVEVFDQSAPREDSCLGGSCVELGHQFLEEARRKRQLRELELGPVTGRSQSTVSGTAKIEVGWEPSLVFNSASSARAVAWVVLRSPQVLRVLSVLLLGAACLFLLVARSSRWLCSGPSMARCEEAGVPGADTCALLSALGAFAAASVHFLGSAGLFGSGWDDRPPTLVEFAEADIDDDDDDEDEDAVVDGSNLGSPAIQLQMQAAGTFPNLRWDVEVTTNLLPKISFVAVRLLAFLTHLAALQLAVLALMLVWASDGDSTFVAEAAYLDVVAVLLLVAAGATVWHEGRLLREQADRWRIASENAHRRSNSLSRVDGTGGSGEAGLSLEDLTSRASGRLQTPLAAVQRLQGNAQQLLRGRLDELGLAQPLLDPLVQALQRV